MPPITSWRFRAACLAAALSTFVASCADDGADSTSSPTAPPTTPGNAAGPAAPTTRPAPVHPDLIPDPDPGLLGSIVLFPGELPGPYDALPLDVVESGYRPAGGDLANALDPADEADDIIRYGQVAEFTTAFGLPASLAIATSAAQFATADGATGYVTDWVEDLRAGASAPSTDRYGLADFTSTALQGYGDQAVRVEYTATLLLDEGEEAQPSGAVAVRSGNLVVWLWATGDGAYPALDALTPLVANRVVAGFSGDLESRDQAALGLTEPPTLALDSFAFSYSYGLESAEISFTVTVDGLFEGPDLASCRTVYAAEDLQTEESYLVAAGIRVWLGDFSGYEETGLRDPAALSALASCPGHQNYWEVTRLHRIPVTGGTESTREGIPVRTRDLVEDEQALLTAGFIEAEIAEFTRYEMTVAVEGGWPIAADLERSMDLRTALALFGLPDDEIRFPDAPAIVTDRLRITRINDEAIRVDLPLLSG